MGSHVTLPPSSRISTQMSGCLTSNRFNSNVLLQVISLFRNGKRLQHYQCMIYVTLHLFIGCLWHFILSDHKICQCFCIGFAFVLTCTSGLGLGKAKAVSLILSACCPFLHFISFNCALPSAVSRKRFCASSWFLGTICCL